MKSSYTPALAVGIGAVAGLRALAAPAVLAWAVEKQMDSVGKFAICQNYFQLERRLVAGPPQNG